MRCPAVLVFTALLAAPAFGVEEKMTCKPELVSVRKIWDQAPHCAFTDLIRFNDNWFCTFRESDQHVHGLDGKIRVLMSGNGEKWESAALIEELGRNLRDSKLSIRPDGRLMLVLGRSLYKDGKLITCQSGVTFSKNGRNWTPLQPVVAEGEWLWRITWHEGRAYGVTYQPFEDKDWVARLYSSTDGLRYELIAALDVPDWPSEVTLQFAGDEMIALVRRDAGNKRAWIGSSKAPYKEWAWKEAGVHIGGPNFIVLPGGEMWAGGRCPTGKTSIGRLTREDYTPLLVLPSGGDTSYPGLVWHDGLLWVSYYSSHEGRKTSIYLATVKLPGAAGEPAQAGEQK